MNSATTEHYNNDASSKRLFIKTVAVAVGATTSGVRSNILLGFLSLTSHSARAEDESVHLGSRKLGLLKSICSLVIPSTETPGAGDIGVHNFIDNYLLACSDRISRERIYRVLDQVAASSVRRYSGPFDETDPEFQFAMLADLENGAAEFGRREQDDFRCLKKMICFGYYTSEVGAAEELRYLPIPGGFDGSIAYAQAEASWSLIGE